MFKYKNTQSESSLEAKAIKLSKEHGWLTYKFTSSERGVPDRIFIKNGLTVFVEFKKKGEKLRELQKHQQKRIRDQGVPALYFDSINDFKKLIIMCKYQCSTCFKYSDSSEQLDLSDRYLGDDNFPPFQVCRSCSEHRGASCIDLEFTK